MTGCFQHEPRTSSVYGTSMQCVNGEGNLTLVRVDPPPSDQAHVYTQPYELTFTGEISRLPAPSRPTPVDVE